MDFLKRKKIIEYDLCFTSRMFFRPMLYSMGCNLLLGHEVRVCPEQLFFFFFLNGGEENRPEHNKVEKNVESIHCMYNNNRG